MTQPPDPYRDWLRQRLGREFGVREADTMIQAAILRRGWEAVRVLGPRDAVAVLQDVYQKMRDDGGETGEARADRWLQDASAELARLAESVPAPIQPSAAQEEARPKVTSWGRRSHDLPLMVARVHHQIAGRSLAAIRQNPHLTRLERAAEWDLQATQAELRRWETEDQLSRLRADHARAEITDQVASARAQLELLGMTVRELEARPQDSGTPTQLAHHRLMMSQTQSFLDAFAPLVREEDADAPLQVLEVDLQHARFSLGVPLHPNVLRARYALNFALWQAGAEGEQALGVQEAGRALAQAEAEAAAQLRTTLDAALAHQSSLEQLRQHVEELERRALSLSKGMGDPIALARLRLEWRQARAAARVQSNRLEEATHLLEALVSGGAEANVLN